MGRSIQRGGHWWNQRPDGVWLRWSPESQQWEPQAIAPPPPAPPRAQVPPSPPIVQPLVTSAPDPRAGGAGAAQPPVSSSPSEFAETGKLPVARREGDTRPLGIVEAVPRPTSKANDVVISAPRRDAAAVFENQKVVAALGIVAILLVFVGTYLGATKVFGGTAAVAGEPAVRKPRAMSQKKWNYIQKADAICTQANKKGRYFERRIYASMTASDLDEMGDALRDARAYIQKVNARLGRLRRPQDDRRLLDRLFKRVPVMLAIYDRLVAGVESGSVEAVEAATNDLRVAEARSNILSDRYGFQVC